MAIGMNDWSLGWLWKLMTTLGWLWSMNDNTWMVVDHEQQHLDGCGN